MQTPFATRVFPGLVAIGFIFFIAGCGRESRGPNPTTTSATQLSLIKVWEGETTSGIRAEAVAMAFPQSQFTAELFEDARAQGAELLNHLSDEVTTAQSPGKRSHLEDLIAEIKRGDFFPPPLSRPDWPMITVGQLFGAGKGGDVWMAWARNTSQNVDLVFVIETEEGRFFNPKEVTEALIAATDSLSGTNQSLWEAMPRSDDSIFDESGEMSHPSLQQWLTNAVFPIQQR